jgi:AGZA family xanthine/uracil permease-like MFS transporter|nr:NCS2 family permease [Candidatus Krumholzibacteria bacterium]
MLEKLFKLEANKTTPSREVAAGVTTFLTMGYIIFVNPNILSATGMDKGALITATILAAALGTILAGLWANVPFAMAPGMGLNAFFAFTLVLGKGVTWQTALGVVFVSGVFFLLLTVLGVRKYVIAAIPFELRLAIAAGIGLFITFIGFQGLGLIVNNDAVLVGLGSMSRPVVLGLIGLLVITILEIRKVQGSILIGILVTTILGLVFKEVTMPSSLVGAPPSIAPIFLQMDIGSALKMGMWGAIFSFMFVDLFDSVGTIVACSYEAGLVNEDGSIDRLDRVLEADAVATIAGSLLGTSTTTTYIESGAGIAGGARTGLANVATGVLFLLALFITPIIGIVPAFATAPALIIVGVYMFKNVANIDFKSFEIGVPAFMTIILMPLTYSISMGLAFGFIAYIVTTAAAGKVGKIHPFMWGIGAFSVLDIVLTTL